MTASAGDLVVNLRADASRFRKEMSKSKQETTSFATHAKNALIGVGAAYAALRLGKHVTDAASDMEETMNKFNVVFSRNSQVVKKWADDFAVDIGRSKQQIADFLASSQDLFMPLGFDATAAEEMSKQVTRLAIDVASFNDKLDADVLRDFHAALTGGGETVKKYGVVLSEAGVKAELLKMGLDPTTAANAEKAQARLNILLRGTTAAQGDAARSADSYANVTKSLDAAMNDLSVTLGGGTMTLGTRLKKDSAEFVRNIDRGIQRFVEFFGGDVSPPEGIKSEGVQQKRLARMFEADAASGIAKEIEQVRNQIGLITGEAREYDAMISKFVEKGEALPENIHELKQEFEKLADVKFAKQIDEEMQAVQQQLRLMKGEITDVDVALSKFEGRGDEHKLTALREMLMERERLEKQLEQDERLANQSVPGDREATRRASPSSGLAFGSSAGMSAVLARLSPNGGKRPEEETAKHTGELLKESKNFFANFNSNRNNLLNQRAGNFEVAGTPWEG